MQNPPENLSEEAKKAIHAAKNAAQQVEVVRQTQLEEAAIVAARLAAELAASKISERVVDRHEMKEMIDAAIMRGFSFEDTDGRRRFIDVTKEKLICQSIVNISQRLDAIEGNLTWTVRIVLGAVILAVLGLIFVK